MVLRRLGSLLPLVTLFRLAQIIGGMTSALKASDLKCSPAAEIHFMAQRSYGRSFYADGTELSSAEVQIADHWRYVRIEILDANGGRAWTNPFVTSNE